MAFPTGWLYRKSITLSRASGAVTNYQMKLTVGESSGATGEDVDCGGLCKTDFSDLRFTNNAGTLLDYWVESVSGATPNQLATIWIEFDSIGTGATTFYMYYGKADASSVSDGPSTFLFFDDFSGTLTDKWNVGAGWSNSGGICTGVRAGGVNSSLSGKTAFATNTLWRTRQKSQSAGAYTTSFGLTNSGGSTAYFRAYYSYSGNGNAHKYTQYYGSWDTGVDIAGWEATNYHILTVKRNGTTSTISTIDDANTVTKTSFVPQGNMLSNMDILFQDGSSILIDWIFCGQFLATEPAWGAWGNQETLGGIIIPVFFSQYRRRWAA